MVYGSLQTMVSGIPVVNALGSRVQDPCVYVVFEVPSALLELTSMSRVAGRINYERQSSFW